MRLATVAVCLVVTAACDGSAGSTVPTPIEYPAGPNDVLIQVGDYDFGFPDEFLIGPEIVVYGDGRAFADLRDPTSADASGRRPVTGELDDATIQSLLRAAADVPADAAVGEPAVDEFPTLLIAHDRQWALADSADGPATELLTEVRDAIDAMPTTEWEPEQWTVRSPGSDCTLSDAPLRPSYLSAPIYPHLVGTDPFADFDCAG